MNRKVFQGLYCITAEKYSRGRSNIETAEAIINAGVKILQYREKEKSNGDKYYECLKLRAMTRQNNVLFIVNDNVDIAIAVGADGVHIGQEDLPVEIVRTLVGDEMIIGVSTHSPNQALEAACKGADYIGVGPIYPTKTKADVCRAVGIEYLDYVVKNISIPYVAIGGIKIHNIQEILKHGGKCIAMVTEIVSAPDINVRINEVTKLMKLR
jgi:thiamine-phosphate pyrophosphorylase